jgi:hypothetical protein
MFGAAGDGGEPLRDERQLIVPRERLGCVLLNHLQHVIGQREAAGEVVITLSERHIDSLAKEHAERRSDTLGRPQLRPRHLESIVES